MELENKVALVTGAGSGIGHAVAEALSREGAAVAINYLGFEQEAKQLAQRLSKAGGRAVAIRADVSDSGQVAAMVDQVVHDLGGLDVLVNNAGIERKTPLLDVEDAEWESILKVNLTGAFYCMRACGRVMRERGGGSIVNISSVHEDRPFPGFAPYCAAKGGLRMLMRDAALELAPHRIRVNNVAPGAIATPINQQTMADPGKMAALQSIVPLGRMGRPAEVADVVVYLASDRSSYVTGSTYFVDGGMMQYAQAL